MSSDSNIYIKTIETDSELGSFEITGTGATSLITPNPTKPGYSLSQTSFVVGSDQLNDDSSTTNKDTRMLFDKSTGAFRAGTVQSTQWDSASRGTNSAALGLNNIASGANSFAAGSGNTASGINTIALGLSNIVNNTTEGTVSVAIGSGNTIPNTSQWGIAIGKDNTTSTGNTPILIGVSNTNGSNHTSIAIGQTNQSTGTNSVAIGNNNTSTAANTFTGGNVCNATNTNAVAIGQYCTASGVNSFAIGYGIDANTNANNATGVGSIAIGYKNNVSGENSVAIGKHNNIVSGANNAYAIGQSCSITSANATESIIMGTNATMDANTGTRCFFWNGDESPRTMPTSTTGSVCFNCSAGGAFKIHFAGGVASTATSTNTGYAWASSSSRDLKENLVEHDYSDTLTRIMDMPIYTYNFKTVDPGIKSIGPVAQDFNRLFPSDKDQLSIVERDMCGVALAGVKGVKLGLDDLSESVDSRFASNSETSSALQSRIAVLESSLVSASAQIAAMESRLAALEAP